jgi:hypothetical protein
MRPTPSSRSTTGTINPPPELRWDVAAQALQVLDHVLREAIESPGTTATSH